MKEDRIFLSPAHAGSFRFNEDVARVFDNMISRSVPLYEEITRLTARFAAQAAQSDTNIYDLGCSTCSTLLAIREQLDPSNSVKLIGCDPSEAMLAKAREKITPESAIELRCENAQEAELTDASAIIMNFTLQFVPPAERPAILKKICDSLLPGGIFVFSFSSFLLAIALKTTPSSSFLLIWVVALLALFAFAAGFVLPLSPLGFSSDASIRGDSVGISVRLLLIRGFCSITGSSTSNNG